MLSRFLERATGTKAVERNGSVHFAMTDGTEVGTNMPTPSAVAAAASAAVTPPKTGGLLDDGHASGATEPGTADPSPVRAANQNGVTEYSQMLSPPQYGEATGVEEEVVAGSRQSRSSSLAESMRALFGGGRPSEPTALEEGLLSGGDELHPR